MPQNKRPVKSVKSVRMTPATVELLNRLSTNLEISEGQVIANAIAEYCKNHPDYLLETKH